MESVKNIMSSDLVSADLRNVKSRGLSASAQAIRLHPYLICFDFENTGYILGLK